jgi:hypothetical protein
VIKTVLSYFAALQRGPTVEPAAAVGTVTVPQLEDGPNVRGSDGVVTSAPGVADRPPAERPSTDGVSPPPV